MFDQIGETLHGFTVTRIRESAELGGRLVEMVYEKTGTELVWVDNGIENKLFSIAFKTLPEQSTGVFHILEHSVLCGSAKYPVREPFVELLKSSMNTFLNAMTFPDKTMYPVSSRNPRDFLNLTEVYLDAVFAPRILEDPNIFCQEGWHIEEAEDGTLTYKGVVFNEMKGATSSVDDQAEYKMLEMLFPDTCYGFNSGGDPAVIPSLTYETFCETYRRFYHPSNARIFLDGSVPMEETLRLIDAYLCKYEKCETLPVIGMQKPVSAEETIAYDLAKEEPIEDRGCLSIGKIAGTWDERAKLLAIRVLNDAVAGSNEAPIKRAVLSAGLAQEMDVMLDDSIAQPFLLIHLKNTADGRDGEILPLIRRTAAELLEKGLDRAALEASANRLEFRLLEPDEPQGLDRCINAMNSWLHGGDPMQYLVYADDFAAVRKMIADGSFDALLRALYIDEEGTAVLHSVPSYTRGEELRKDEADRLAKIRAAWTDADLEANRARNASLLAWQQTPDTPEQLATLPVLDLSEVSDQPSLAETEVTEHAGVTVLYHPAACSGIVHLALYFRLTDRTLEDITLLNIAADGFGKLPTKRHGALELQQLLKNTVGRLNIGVEMAANRKDSEHCTPLLAVRSSVLEEKLPAAFDLILEVMQETDFSQKDKIREFILQMDERAKMAGVMAGHALGMSIAMSRYSARGAVADALSGYASIMRLHQLAKNFDAEFDAFTAGISTAVQETFCRARLIASVTAAKPADISALLDRLPEGTAVPEKQAYRAELPERTGYTIPAQIGFAVQGYALPLSGIEYQPAMAVATKIISLSYLWNTVRVQGGAYGTGISAARDGSVFTYSYRDPTPAATLEVNRGISDFIRGFVESDEPLDKYIISRVSDGDPLRSPREEGAFADALWLSGETKDDLIASRRGMLATTRAQLLETCAAWDALCEKGAVCVVASEAQLAGCGGLTILTDAE